MRMGNATLAILLTLLVLTTAAVRAQDAPVGTGFSRAHGEKKVSPSSCSEALLAKLRFAGILRLIALIP